MEKRETNTARTPRNSARFSQVSLFTGNAGLVEAVVANATGFIGNIIAPYISKMELVHISNNRFRRLFAT